MSASNNSNNFSNYIEDFSTNQEFIDKFTEILGISPDEASKLSFEERKELMFDGTIDCILANNTVEEALANSYKKQNLIAESKKDVDRRINSLSERELITMYVATQQFMKNERSIKRQEGTDAINYLISKGFLNSYFNCKICGKTHRLSNGNLTEHTLALHQEIAFKHVGEFFLEIANLPKSTKVILNKMHEELLSKLSELHKLYFTTRIRFGMIMRTLYNCYLESVKFFVEFSLTLMNVLKRNASRDTHKNLLIAKTIYELVHFIRNDGIHVSPTSFIRQLRSYQLTELYNLFETIQAEVSEDLYLFYCSHDRKVTSKVINEFIDKIDKCVKLVNQFNDTLITTSMIAIEGDIKTNYTEKFTTLFKLMEIEFSDDFKIQFLKLFTQEAYEKYKEDNKLTDEETLSFEKGKRFDLVLDFIMEINHVLINSIINNIEIDWQKETTEFPSNVFLRTGYKLWFDYDYTEEEDPFLYDYKLNIIEFKKELLKNLTQGIADVDYVLLPRTYNDKLTLYRSFKTDQEWLDNYVPVAPNQTYRDVYIYFLNNPKLSHKLIFKSETPDLKMLSKNELDTILKIFRVTEEEFKQIVSTLIKS